MTNNWYVQFADANSYASGSNSFFDVVSNQLKLVVVPNTGYAGPISVVVYVSGTASFAAYGLHTYTFAFGDTAISAASTNFIAPQLIPLADQLLATFTNGVPNSSANDFTAFINWGDNSTNSGVIMVNALGQKEVRGSHVYTNSGDYPVYTTLQSALGANSTVIGTASVPPSLTLARAETHNAIAWPAWAFAYQLLSATNLASPDWVATTNLAQLAAYQNVVTNATVSGNLFFRLKK